MHVTAPPHQTWWFDLAYVWAGQEALFLVGIGLLLAADGRHVK